MKRPAAARTDRRVFVPCSTRGLKSPSTPMMLVGGELQRVDGDYSEKREGEGCRDQISSVSRRLSRPVLGHVVVVDPGAPIRSALGESATIMRERLERLASNSWMVAIQAHRCGSAEISVIS